MSTVIYVGVKSGPPGAQQPSGGTRTSGSSNTRFTFYGVYADAMGKCVVVVQADTYMSGNLSSVDPLRDGGVFVAGSAGNENDGNYCLLTTDRSDLNNWTVRLRTDKDKAGTGTTFVAGTGGGGK